jgi:phosphoglycerate kinase
MKTLSSFKLRNKVVLLRADLNCNVGNGKVIESERIKESANTIKTLKKKKAKIVIMAHQGRPNRKDFVGLKQHARFLSKYTKVKFVANIVGRKAVNEIKKLKPGEALLLENIRFEKEEYKPEKGKNNKIVKALLPLIDIYVNDAFSNSHRNHVSMASFAKYKPSCAGSLMIKELNALEKIKVGRALFILGGAKPKDNLKLIGKGKILACGLFGQMCLIAKGKNLGAQNKYLKRTIKDYSGVLKKLRKGMRNVIPPVDFAVKVKGKRKELFLTEFPSRYEIFDIGKKTQELFVKEIKKAKSIYMKGPVGDFSSKGFEKGTFAILRAIAKHKGFSLLGGGHLVDAIKASKISIKKFGHISLSGGALLRVIAGEKLPGVEVLG